MIPCGLKKAWEQQQKKWVQTHSRSKEEEGKKRQKLENRMRTFKNDALSSQRKILLTGSFPVGKKKKETERCVSQIIKSN